MFQLFLTCGRLSLASSLVNFLTQVNIFSDWLTITLHIVKFQILNSLSHLAYDDVLHLMFLINVLNLISDRDTTGPNINSIML